ncbi:MAG: hypothetical protein E6Q34_08135 [Burkholderiaceae bacterium]|nr:MAG: hypothetical protein E6Q34_08135 [Burkholderiaceae bacterium]
MPASNRRNPGFLPVGGSEFGEHLLYEFSAEEVCRTKLIKQARHIRQRHLRTTNEHRYES